MQNKKGDIMEKEYFNQRINCNVAHCKYYDKANTKCSLGAINVSVNNCSETCCDSYEKSELK